MQVVRRIPLHERVPGSQQGNKTVSMKDYEWIYIHYLPQKSIYK